ncbi:MAG: ATP phosphoribosyltransferase regulatory subunit [Nanoarchaeota archaeon]|nr:ATP phosphoribosyltransferase regulatory subunit [Nanoarchaeota archaeon]
MKIELAKGVRDFGPEQKLLRQEIVDTLRCVFERYGYAPIETPIIERMDVLSAKFGAGQESDATRETFQFQDQGGRKLGLRFDLTVPFARFVAMNPNLKMPFKRYQIERVYRDGPIKLGRYREFWQCDVDVAGTKSMLADAEMIDIALTSFKDLGLDVVIEFNNRKLLDGMMEFAGITKARRDKAIIVIDKFKKSSKGDLETEWKENGLDEEAFVKLYGILNTQGKNNQETLNLLK